MKNSDSFTEKLCQSSYDWNDIGIQDLTIFIVSSGSSNVVPVYLLPHTVFFFKTVQIFGERKILKKNIKYDHN